MGNFKVWWDEQPLWVRITTSLMVLLDLFAIGALLIGLWNALT